MADSPPSPATKTLARVLAISGVNGWAIAVVSGLGSLISLAMGDFSGAAVGLIVCFAGYVEIKGNRQLRRRDADGMRRLINAQMTTLAVVLVYCTMRLLSFDGELVMSGLTPDMENVLKESDIAREDILPLVKTLFVAVYGSMGLATLIYQGGLGLYYRNRKPLVEQALAAPPVVVLPDQSSTASE